MHAKSVRHGVMRDHPFNLCLAFSCIRRPCVWQRAGRLCSWLVLAACMLGSYVAGSDKSARLQHGEEQQLILLDTDQHSLPLMLNALLSLSDFYGTERLVRMTKILCFDQPSCEFLSNAGFQLVAGSIGSAVRSGFNDVTGTINWLDDYCLAREHALLHLLSTGKTVLRADSDVFFHSDPFKHQRQSGADIFVSGQPLDPEYEHGMWSYNWRCTGTNSTGHLPMTLNNGILIVDGRNASVGQLYGHVYGVGVKLLSLKHNGWAQKGFNYIMNKQELCLNRPNKTVSHSYSSLLNIMNGSSSTFTSRASAPRHKLKTHVRPGNANAGFDIGKNSTSNTTLGALQDAGSNNSGKRHARSIKGTSHAVNGSTQVKTALVVDNDLHTEELRPSCSRASTMNATGNVSCINYHTLKINADGLAGHLSMGSKLALFSVCSPCSHCNSFNGSAVSHANCLGAGQTGLNAKRLWLKQIGCWRLRDDWRNITHTTNASAYLEELALNPK